MTPKTKIESPSNKAWVISVDMGYGHQRAAYPLGAISEGGIINADTYSGIPQKDKKIWQNSRRFYEFISRFKQVPFIGDKVFDFYDKLQNIPTYYPKRDLSEPTFQVEQVMGLIRKSDWGKHLIEKLAKKPLPIVTTFFVPAFMAEYFNYPGEIYCLATDSDISRAWVPENPSRSRIRYFAPTHRVADRLRLYGIREQNIFLTGFPLPDENIGGPNMDRLKKDILYRLVNLDPERKYYSRYHDVIQHYLGYRTLPTQSFHPLTLMFPVGGAGAQRELAITIMRSLKDKIMQHKITYILAAGINTEVSEYFRQSTRDVGLGRELGKHVVVTLAKTKDEYFRNFNQMLRTTDILWSKPSELSFYTALGIPLIIAPPIGSQEEFNKRWIETVGSGTFQEDPQYTHEWLFDWLDSGWLAEAAMEGFVEAPKRGLYNISKIVAEKIREVKEIKSILPF